MTVHIQRELSSGVTEVGLHGFDVITGRQGTDCEAVSEIMESGIIGNACPLGDLFEMLYHSTANQILAQVIREDKIERVVPDVDCPDSGRLLLLVFVPEGIHHQRSKEDHAALTVLACFQKVVTVNVESQQKINGLAWSGLRKAVIENGKTR